MLNFAHIYLATNMLEIMPAQSAKAYPVGVLPTCLKGIDLIILWDQFEGIM